MKVRTTLISASSRASVKVGDSYYTVEFKEERSISEDASEADLQVERESLWNTVNTECDNQIADIVATYKSQK